MKKSLIYIVSIIFSMVLCNQVNARVTGACSNCHTMHNSQGGAPMAFQINTGHTGSVSVESPNPQLLLTGCVGCHTAFDGYTWKDSVTGAPIVYNTGGYPANPLAGGNFYCVADYGGDDDTKGHNVLGISTQDVTLSTAPGGNGCAGCHTTLAVENTSGTLSGKSGCEGCHINVMHHADDGTGTKYVGSADKGWYRFLSGHMTASGGVKGIEDKDWGYNDSSSNHNEYLGVNSNTTADLDNGNMTAFCCGCHGNFHSSSTGSGSQSPWFRHPSDFVIPNSGEYSNAFGAKGGIGIYDPYSPVARPSGFAGFNSGEPNCIVNLGTDMVMCLTCHRSHGSQYYKMLRWDYKNWPGGGGTYYGCGKCHTSKN